MINPAVGAPVHAHAGSPGHGGLFYPAVGGGGGLREPAGYFDAAYFPPMSGGPSGLGASGLANEIMKDSAEKERGENGEGGKGKADWRGEGEGKDEEEVDNSPFDVGTSEGEAELEERGGERARRHSSTTKTAWQATTDGDLRVWEGREGVEGEGEAGEAALELEADGTVISRTHSMSSSKKPVGLLSHRSESDPPPTVSSTGAESGEGSSNEDVQPLGNNTREGRHMLESGVDQWSR